MYYIPIFLAKSSQLLASSSSSAWSSSSIGTYWNQSIRYGVINDSRDGKSYRTVKVGTQTWMAENLNYDTANGTASWCYDNDPDNCAIYGRYYYWHTAKKVCPSGWHLPTASEYDLLLQNESSQNPQISLMANTALWHNNLGVDSYGFAALPGGEYALLDGNLLGNVGFWWTSTENVNSFPSTAYYFELSAEYVPRLAVTLAINGNNIRCIAD
jgi:uncharacterized protein (TIGR02145 family)